MSRTSSFLTISAGLCLALSGGLQAQPTVGVSITGKLGPIIPPASIAGGNYQSGITATGTAGQTCEMAFTNGGGSNGSATVKLTGTNTIAAGTALVIVNPGRGYTTPPTTANVVAGGTATCNIGGSVTVTTKFDPLSLNNTNFSATTTLNPVNVTYNASSISYNGLTITIHDAAFPIAISCTNATATVTVNDAGDGGYDTMRLSNCNLSELGLTGTFASVVAFPAGTIPAPIPLAFHAPNLINSPTSASEGTYVINTSGGPATTSVGITGGITTTCNNCPAMTLSPAGPLTFNATTGGGPPTAQNVTVGTGGTVMAYAVTTSTTSGGNWLTVNGSTTTGGSTGGSFAVNVNPASLGVGNYTGTVTVYTAASNTPQSVTVNLAVSPPVFNLVASPGSMTFNSVNNSVPLGQTLNLSTSPAQSSVPFTASVSTTDGAPWLSVPLSGTIGSSGTNISVSVDPTQVRNGAGTYTGKITLNATNASNNPQTVNVTLNVSTLTASPTSLTFTTTVGQPNPPSQPIIITESGPSVSYTASTSTSWLSVSPTSGTTSGTLNASVAIGSLTANTYTGNIQITPAGGTAINVGVTFKLNPLPTLQVSPSTLTFNMVTTGTLPTAQSFTVNASDGSSIPFTTAVSTTTGGSWLSATPSGSTPNGNVAVSIASAASSLTPGTYTGTVTVSSTGASGPAPVSVTLIVSGINVSPTPLNFTFQIGGSNPPNQTLNISSTSSTQLGFTAAASTTSGGSWLSVSPTSGTTPLGLTVTATPGTLTAATYNGSIKISSGGASVTVQVTFLISSLPSVTTAPPIMSFAFTIGGTVPGAQTLSIGSNGTALTGVSVASSTPWLSVQPNGTNTPFTASISLIQAALPTTPGTYNGTVSISAPASANAAPTPLAYTVTLTVAPQPVLSVTPNPLTFTGIVNGANPTAQMLSVNSTNVSVSFTATQATTSGGNWLSVTPGSGNTNTSLMVSVSTTGLAIGTYKGSVTVTAPAAAGSPAVIPVTLNITAQPLLSANPGSLTFSYVAGAPIPTGQSVAITTSNNASATVTLTHATTSGGSWLSVSPGSLTAPGGFMANIAPAGLSAGAYSGTITISAPGFISTTVNVSLTVTQPKAVLQVSGNTLFSLPNTSAPVNQNLSVTASDGSAQQFTVSLGASATNWLKISPTSGSTPATVVMTANPTGLAPGSYLVNLTVTAPALPVPSKTVLVQLNITGSNLTSNPSTLSFTYQPGVSLPAAQKVTVSPATGSGTVPLSSIASDVSWIQVTPASSAPATLQVSIVPGLLTPGNYSGDVKLTAAGSPVTSLVIPVSLVVNAEPQLTLTPATLDFTYQAGGALPAPQSFAVSTGAIPLNYTATSPGNWLQISPIKGSTPGTVLVTANPVGLGQGTYGGKINVSAYGAASAGSVGVTLTVTGAAGITAVPNAVSFTIAAGAAAQTKSVALSSSSSGVTFTAKSGSPWLSVSPTSGSVPGSIAIAANPTGLTAGTYSGSITVTPSGGLAPLIIPVSLLISSGGQVGQPTVLGVINAASGISGVVAPGEIISIFGSNLGPAVGVSFALSSADTVPNTLGGTLVTFDNTAVPLFYSSNGQVNALVPFEVANKKTTEMKVTFGGQTSTPITIPVQATLPGLFTANASGTGEGAILNSDSTVNSASNPAKPGLPIQLFGNGGGDTIPASTDGDLNPLTSTGKLAAAPTTVTIGGQPAVVQYAGPAPGLVAGVIQVNAVIPANTPSGAATVVLTIGGNSSPSVVTVQVQ